MGCACKGRTTAKFVWTAPDGTGKIVYPSEIQAKAKVIRSGGTYTKQAND